MSNNFKYFKTFLVSILAISIYAFHINQNSDAPKDQLSFDQDVIEAQNFNSASETFLTSFPTAQERNPIGFGGYFNLSDTITLAANPGPANNGGSPNWAMFFDLIAGSNPIIVTQMSTANTSTAGGSFSVEVFTRSGTALGGPVSSGPGSSPAGWTSIGTAQATQGPTSSGISEIFSIPPIAVDAGDTVGVALRFTGSGPRYFGTGTPPYSTYADTNLTLITGDGRSMPFTPTGSFFTSRALTGVLRYVVDGSTGVINIGTEISDGFSLSQNYPNPFNPVTKINFNIPSSSTSGLNSNVKLTVYDIRGNEISVLVNEQLNPGVYEVDWDAGSYASGVYFYKLQTVNFTSTKKMTLLK